MSNDLTKLASQIPAITQEAAGHLRKLAHQNVELVQENESLKAELRLHKIARRMEERRIDGELSFEEKVARLQQVPGDKIDALETAIEISPGGFKLGSLQDGEETGSGGGEGLSVKDQQHQLDTFILSGQALA
jgi:hypothetical protein